MVTVDGTGEWFRIPLLMTVGEGLQAGEMSTCFGSCKPRVTEVQRVKRVRLLELEVGDFISQSGGIFIKFVVTFNVGAETPVIEEGGFDEEGGESRGL